MRTVTSISRADLIDICERLIADQPDLPAVWADELREVARTVTRIRGDRKWWSADDECGCLVGSVTRDFPGRALSAWCRWGDHALSALLDIGCEYCDELNRTTLGCDRADVLTVTDEDTA